MEINDKHATVEIDELSTQCVKLNSDKAEGKEPLDVFKSILYHSVWRRQARDIQTMVIPDNGNESRPKNTLIVYPHDIKDLATKLSEKISKNRLIYVEYGDTDSAISVDHWNIESITLGAFDPLLEKIADIDQIYFLGGFYRDSNNDNVDAYRLDCMQQRDVFCLFYLIKSLIRYQHTRSTLDLKIITNRTYPVYTDDKVIPWGGGLLGLSTVFSLEYPDVRSVDIDLSWDTKNNLLDDEGTLQQLIAEPTREAGGIVAFRNQDRYIRTIEPIDLPKSELENLPIKKKGVYLILGGASGIGLVLSRYLIEKFEARIAWAGRSELTEDKKKIIKELEQIGGKIVYYRADGSDLNDMRHVVEKIIDDLGPIQGIVHSAIVLQDKSLQSMEEAQFRDALDPKVKASWVLYEVTKNQPLDFMLFFSSVISHLGNKGQSNYASGCTFKDAFARYLKNNHSIPVKIINWGYWGSVDAVASEDYRRKLESQGIHAIDPDIGTEAISRVLASRSTQIIALKADKSVFENMGLDFSIRCQWVNKKTAIYLDNIDVSVRHSKFPVHKKIFSESYVKLTRWCGQLLLWAYKGMGGMKSSEHNTTVDALKTQLKIPLAYEPFYNSSLSILEKCGLIRIDDGNILTRKDVNHIRISDIEKEKRIIENDYPWFDSEIKFLWEGIRNLSNIVVGMEDERRDLTKNRLSQYIESIQRDSLAARHRTKKIVGITSKLVKTTVSLLGKGEKLRILYIGSDSIRANDMLVKSLGERKYNIEFHYASAVSDDYLPKEYENLFPYCLSLNLEKSLVDQGFDMGSYDFIHITNSLNSTGEPDIALRNVKYLLKSGGILIVDEYIHGKNMMTLMLNLLRGINSTNDKSPHSRDLHVPCEEKWEQLFDDESFINKKNIEFLEIINKTLPRYVAISQSDGLIRFPCNLSLNSNADQVNSNIKYKKPIEPTLRKIMTELDSAPKDKVLSHLQDYIKDIIEEIMRIDVNQLNTSARLFQDSELSDMGIDSLAAIDFCSRLRHDLDVEVSEHTLIGTTTVHEITILIYEQLLLRLLNLDKSKYLSIGRRCTSDNVAL